MTVREIRLDEKEAYNSVVEHPVQAWEWGEFKKNTGVEVVRIGCFEKNHLRKAFQLTFHSIPKTSLTVGYFAKGPAPDTSMLEVLVDLGKKKNAVFIKLEPNTLKNESENKIDELENKFNLVKGRVVFTPYTFLIDLAKSEEELLASMKAKTRYNLHLAERQGVKVGEDNSTKAFEMYLKLTRETSRRQGFYAHDEEYHRLMWEILQPAGIAHLLTATWKDRFLVTWIVFVFKNVLYYPYGASNSEYRNLMASNLIMWEAIKFGKKSGCERFDLWGSLGPDADKKDPWYGFHKFKEGYGGKLVEFLGTYDLVVNPQLYPIYKMTDAVRWKFLRFVSRFR